VNSCPKPARVEKPRSPLRRSGRIARGKRVKFGNAYTQPAWRAQVRRIRKRSKGICEAQVRCGGDPVSGDPHHLFYRPGVKGKQRILVEDAALVDTCRRCHLYFEAEKSK
jgi:hypothetical protein